ncbi:GNAT family N-acetyltransferase [Psychromonas algicola]|uniref:GNAT family N-acetyltransferase n=1 Tax=Psychromonas algicola TaxID=2555642 RepID=UPI0010679576|nr:GNAT family N-acetyltransferase [Psychromonas sp. RZ5]TEW52347.1 N-acetyltransferase [Psychromonas sp. RZ5]
MKYIKATKHDGNTLAEIRAAAMKPSLDALGRFDESIVRNRFLKTFNPDETIKLLTNGDLLGFYVLRAAEDHFYLDHFYIKPQYQNKNIGKRVISEIVSSSHNKGLPVRLGALRGSKSNDFYIANGFIKTHESEFDIYYQSITD